MFMDSPMDRTPLKRPYNPPSASTLHVVLTTNLISSSNGDFLAPDPVHVFHCWPKEGRRGLPPVGVVPSVAGQTQEPTRSTVADKDH